VTIAALGRALAAGLMATFAVFMGGILGGTNFGVGHGTVMTGGTFGFLTSDIGSLGTIGILGMMALGAFRSGLMRPMLKSNGGVTLLGSTDGRGLGTLASHADCRETTNHSQNCYTKYDFLSHFFLLKIKIRTNELQFI
jgi:hypothetical protein